MTNGVLAKAQVSDLSGTSGGNADGVELHTTANMDAYASIFDTGDDSVNLSAGLGTASQGSTPTSNLWAPWTASSAKWWSPVMR